MYTPGHFRVDDPDLIRSMIAGARLPTLVSPGKHGLLATPLPLLLQTPAEGPMQLIGHVARANRHWQDFDAAQASLAIFSGPDAYVSPAHYAEKAATGKVVPTWNYEAVHVQGRLTAIEDPGALLQIVTALTNHYEADMPTPWSVTDAPKSYIDAMLRGIVGLVLTVERIDAKQKLSQNKSREDQARIRNALALHERSDVRVLAKAMAAINPAAES